MGVTAINGRMGRVQTNGTNWNFDDCNVKIFTTTGKTTGFEDQAGNGRTPENRTSGNDDITGSISGFIDSASMPGVTFTQGAILTNLKIFLDKNTAARWAGSTNVIIASVTYHPKQADPAQRVTIEFENAGGVINNPL
jgi:hypothetical protein